MTEVRPYQVPVWELNIGSATGTATVSVLDNAVGVSIDEENADTFAFCGNILVKLTATTAKTVTINNETAGNIVVKDLMGTTAGATVASEGNTTVSLTANTPALVAILVNNAVADA